MGEVLTLFPNAGEKKGSCRVLLVFLPGLRGVAAEVEGGTAFFLEIDFGDGARLADGVGPGFPVWPRREGHSLRRDLLPGPAQVGRRTIERKVYR